MGTLIKIARKRHDLSYFYKKQDITTLQRKKKELLLKAPYFYLMKS